MLRPFNLAKSQHERVAQLLTSSSWLIATLVAGS